MLKSTFIVGPTKGGFRCFGQLSVISVRGRRTGARIVVAIVSTAMAFAAPRAFAWDSQHWSNVIHSTHSYLTEFAIDRLESVYPELLAFRAALIDGANTELHELPVSGTLYGVDLDAARIRHRGTNDGSDDVQGWWRDSLAAYRGGDRQQAYFYLGVVLHMVEDMGVPAHANHVYHQGNLTEFDNFEFMGLSNWRPDYSAVNRIDPGFANPSLYYAFQREWTHSDAPNYNDPDSFSKTWTFASDRERALLSKRQGSTAVATMWTLRSALFAFGF